MTINNIGNEEIAS